MGRFIVLYILKAVTPNCSPQFNLNHYLTQTVEALIFNVERTQTPPYYRFTKKHTSSHDEPEPSSSYHHHIHLDKGQIHTKRHSAEDPQNKLQDESVAFCYIQ